MRTCLLTTGSGALLLNCKHTMLDADLIPYHKPFRPERQKTPMWECSFDPWGSFWFDWVYCFLLQVESNGLFETRAQVLSVLYGLSKVPQAAREKAMLRFNMAISINQALSNESAWHRPAVFSFAMFELQWRERKQAVRQYMVWHSGKDRGSAHGYVQIRGKM